MGGRSLRGVYRYHPEACCLQLKVDDGIWQVSLDQAGTADSMGHCAQEVRHLPSLRVNRVRITSC